MIVTIFAFMGNSINYLEVWYDYFRSYKWKTGQINNEYFKNLDKIYNELKSFFPPKDFIEGNVEPDNWLIHLLANKRYYSVQLITEVAELIRFYRSIDHNESYGLITQNGLINYRQFNEILLELYVNYILRQAGLNPLIGEYYESKKGNKKAQDIYFELSNNNYNVEITKYYDNFADKLYDLSITILRIIGYKVKKSNIKIDELFTGYIGIKNQDAIVISKLKESFKSILKEYFHSFRSGLKVINYKPPKINDDFEIVIQPAYMSTKQNLFDEELKKFPTAIKFNFAPKSFQSQIANFTVNVMYNTNKISKNEDLIKKIQKKITQHKDFSGRTLIVVGIDNILSSFNKGIVPAIRFEEVDRDFIFKALSLKDNDHIILLIFKEAIREQQIIKYLLIGDFNYHAELDSYLAPYFDKKKEGIRYSG